METGKEQDFDWEVWRAMLKKAHTNEEYSAVAQALPNLREPLEPIASINDYIVTSDHYRPLDDIQFNSLCHDHVKLFEKAIGLPLQDFLCNPDRLYIALTKAVPVSLHTTGLMNNGRTYDWLDVRCHYVGVDSDLWVATPYELVVQERLRTIIHVWIEFFCWGIDDDDSDSVKEIKQECLHDYAQLVRAAKRH
jgi:hypothetical protein